MEGLHMQHSSDARQLAVGSSMQHAVGLQGATEQQANQTVSASIEVDSQSNSRQINSQHAIIQSAPTHPFL
jgi:hypothetical protein